MSCFCSVLTFDKLLPLGHCPWKQSFNNYADKIYCNFDPPHQPTPSHLWIHTRAGWKYFFQQWINNGFTKNFIVISASWQAGSPPNILCALHSLMSAHNQPPRMYAVFSNIVQSSKSTKVWIFYEVNSLWIKLLVVGPDLHLIRILCIALSHVSSEPATAYNFMRVFRILSRIENHLITHFFWKLNFST